MTSADTAARYYGVDIGAQKSIVVSDDGDIVRTSTGSVARPTLISFSNARRVFGDEAFAQITAEYTLPLLPLILGRSLEEVQAQPWAKHLRVPVESDEAGRLFLSIHHDLELEEAEPQTRFYVTSLLGSYIAQIVQQIGADDAHYCFSVHTPDESVRTSVMQACHIAGLSSDKVSLVDPVSSLVAAYARKITGLGGAEAAGLVGKQVLLVDMGHCQTTLARVCFESNTQSLPTVLRSHYTPMGAFHYDLLLFSHFQQIWQAKHQISVEPGTKKGLRLLLACERVRKLLSQLPEAQVVVENISDNADLTMRLTREELHQLCASLSSAFSQLVAQVCTDTAPDASSVAVAVDQIEISGGGCRMPSVQTTLSSLLASSTSAQGGATPSTVGTLGAKLDDTSNAIGAVLHVRSRSADSSTGTTPTAETDSAADTAPVDAMDTTTTPARCFEASELNALRDRERALHAYNTLVDRVHHTYNEVEALLLELRGIASGTGNSAQCADIDRAAVRDAVQSFQLLAEDVLHAGREYISEVSSSSSSSSSFSSPAPATPTAEMHTLERKLCSLQHVLHAAQHTAHNLCASYYAQREQARQAVEAELDRNHAEAAANAGADGEDPSSADGDGYDAHNDHSVNRKLKKSDRLRLLAKNKDEGNELFKDGNFQLAILRYQKAVGHINALIEQCPLSAEEKAEMHKLKVNLFNNLALAYSKQEKWELVWTHVHNVLALEATNKKALYRRGCYYEVHKKDWEKAAEDYKKCADMLAPGQEPSSEDKAIAKALERVKKELQRVREKEKKMWGKAFA